MASALESVNNVTVNLYDLFLIIGTYQSLQKRITGIRVLRTNREISLQFAPQGTADRTVEWFSTALVEHALQPTALTRESRHKKWPTFREGMEEEDAVRP